MTEPAGLARVRALCLALPEAAERMSHGEPTWFAGKRTFVMFAIDHHSDGRVAFWCAAAPGMQDLLVHSDPTHYFVPPYVGYRGWVGVRVDLPGVDWDQATLLITDAYRQVAPKRLLALLEASSRSW